MTYSANQAVTLLRRVISHFVPLTRWPCRECGRPGPDAPMRVNRVMTADRLETLSGCTQCNADELFRDIDDFLRVCDAGADELFRALEPLVAIADAYDANELDDEARKFWGPNLEYENRCDPENLDLYEGRGGGRLLTLGHCLRAREVCGLGRWARRDGGKWHATKPWGNDPNRRDGAVLTKCGLIFEPSSVVANPDGDRCQFCTNLLFGGPNR